MDTELERIQEECRTKTIKHFTRVRKFVLEIERSNALESSKMLLEAQREAAKLRGDVWTQQK